MENGIDNKVCGEADGNAINRLYQKAYGTQKRVDGILHRRHGWKMGCAHPIKRVMTKQPNERNLYYFCRSKRHATTLKMPLLLISIDGNANTRTRKTLIHSELARIRKSRQIRAAQPRDQDKKGSRNSIHYSASSSILCSIHCTLPATLFLSCRYPLD